MRLFVLGFRGLGDGSFNVAGLDLGSLSNRTFTGIVLPEGPTTISMVFLDPKENGNGFVVNRKMALKCPSVSF